MKYLVTMEAIEGGAVPPQAMAGMIESLVFPSFEALMSLEAAGKIVGGVSVGQRRIVFIANAKDNTELDKLVESLPVWAMTRTEVTALNGFGKRHATDKQHVSRLKKSG